MPDVLARAVQDASEQFRNNPDLVSNYDDWEPAADSVFRAIIGDATHDPDTGTVPGVVSFIAELHRQLATNCKQQN